MIVVYIIAGVVVLAALTLLALFVFMEGPEMVRDFQDFTDELKDKAEEWRELFQKEDADGA